MKKVARLFVIISKMYKKQKSRKKETNKETEIMNGQTEKVDDKEDIYLRNSHCQFYKFMSFVN